MIEAQDLVKWYGPTLAVDHVSFTIEPGKIVGFLGPNGAGKSTTLRILTGYLPPTSGRAVVNGISLLTAPQEARANVGYLPESNPLYSEMRVVEYLDWRGRLFGMPRAGRRQRCAYMIDRCGLAGVQRRVIGQLSRGNRQRVGLAQALLHDPPVLVLDEPTAGLDPNQVNQFRQLMAELRGKHTIVLSTHILPEVEKVADHVLIIAGGRIVAQGAPAELRTSVARGGRVLVEVQAAAPAVETALRGTAGVQTVQAAMHGDWCRVVVTPTDRADVRQALGRSIAANGWAVREMRFETASLEEFFVQITADQSHARAPGAA